MRLSHQPCKRISMIDHPPGRPAELADAVTGRGSQGRTFSPLPCPFCGASKITVEWEPCPKLEATDTSRRWFAECTECACQGPFCQNESQAIPAWNKRLKMA
ncbi:MAG: hypothetical protein EB141_15045 [Verrucomicrobia bacterium]|nr:hypothetical protein [Verrucomicrobiota bacterium]NBU07433.1 hypothetical protein [Pseudomonadota bacterium]NDA67477.1 hypothetical protein [Verrucomicrobiota bacterium]NDB76932.1 hypothetical protein [Verrucomicrobiota bacterium]NDD39385.1 hypothetical protein [Verrucomicrobiota bacterium]